MPPLMLTENDRARLRRMVQRPRSRKQEHRARALLDLADGQSVEAVARRCRVGVDRVEAWIAGYERLGLKYLAEPPSPRGPGDDEEPDDDE